MGRKTRPILLKLTGHAVDLLGWNCSANPITCLSNWSGIGNLSYIISLSIFLSIMETILLK